ncbi:DUF2461 domain-containing protein [Leptolyngbya sp. KIOST-1]|uniref:DUF2461 domain-containing protein n=1 Tax=Leptolyngbya sp. KIOST-1 TaxID=1229172 RepID=UPI0005670464|nr:DUF2461 domain-containing protein [Leptolyngbya sp. KIOST-1]
MTDLHFTPKTFDLLEGLAANNEKAWYDAHRDEFEAYVRQPFAMMLELATDCLTHARVPLAGGPKTMFRQNRDVRFSKDKSPYSTHVSGVLTPSGTKAEKEGLVYVQLEASGGLVACGYYKLSPAALGPLRDKIVDSPEEFAQVLKDLEEAGLSLSNEDKLTKMPRGYDAYAEHDYADYIKLKSFVAMVHLGRGAWLDGDIVDCIVDYAKNCASLLEFGRINES